MLDQLYGKPSTSFKRTQVLLVLLFWITRIVRSNSVSTTSSSSSSIGLIRKLNTLLARFTPWQIILSTLTIMYGIKNSDAILGLQAPEPLARLYARNYYRATWIVTALDVGFATAMPIEPKWLRDIASVAFSAYYLIFASQADEKLRKYRSVCTVEMLRVTWEKTTNPYLRFLTRGDRPKVGIRRRILLPRPKGSRYTKPITAWLYFAGNESELSKCSNLIFDLPGGGFICMSPLHHEERLQRWAVQTRLPVLSLDYGKAPEYPFPFAINETYDAYRLLVETRGQCIGMSGIEFNIVMTGDSAGANIAMASVIKILETTPRLPLPRALVFAYAALDFNFTSWMSVDNLKVLRSESHSNIAAILRDKEALDHRSPLSVVADVERPRLRKKRNSWSKSFVNLASQARASAMTRSTSIPKAIEDEESDVGGNDERDEQDKSVSERVVFWEDEEQQAQLLDQVNKVGERVLARAAQRGPLETRLAMTSRTAFFNDRIISPPMCRAMALLYVGPRNAPDLHTDYHISPIFTPANLLAQLPPVYLSCGERDPFVDDTVILAARIREAKETRKLELQARGAAKFGEGLRMSTSSTSAHRESILDEDENDWVVMDIIEGWSHGYLQMTSLLPESTKAIDQLAGWIMKAFEKNSGTTSTTKATRPAAVATPPRASTSHSHHSLPARRSPAPSLPAAISTAAPIDASDKEDEDETDVLSFTPRKRIASDFSRSASPAPSISSGSILPLDFTTAAASRVPLPELSAASSSDEATSLQSSIVTPDRRLSPPMTTSHGSGGKKLDYHLVTPVEHALREGFHPHSHSPRRTTSRPRASSRANDGIRGGDMGEERRSDEESVASAHAATTMTGGVGVRELMKNRMTEAVFGISSRSGSAVPSDEEQDE